MECGECIKKNSLGGGGRGGKRAKICDDVPMLLSILHYDNLKLKWNEVSVFKPLREVGIEGRGFRRAKICDGVPMLLSILHYDNLKLIWNVVSKMVILEEF